MTAPRRSRCSGFTLIEVIVAMAVIALGVGALLSTLTSSAGAVTHLRDRSFAQWIALNQISEARLAESPPGTGVTSGEVDYAGTKWLWRQEVLDPGTLGILRVNVSVAHAGQKASKAIQTAEDFPAVATAYGFIGTSVGTPNGLDPSWAPIVLPNPGTGGGGSVIPGTP